jgi:hypothetical protein
MSRIPHFLDNRLADGGCQPRRPRFTPRNIFWYLILLRLNKPYGLLQLEGLGKLNKKFDDLIGARTCDLPATAAACPALLYKYKCWMKNNDSWVGTTTGWTSGVRFKAGTRGLYLLHSIQACSEAYSAYYPTGTRGSFPGGKAAGAWSWPLPSI